MIANNQELIHCVALSYRSLSLLIRGLTSTADEGASPHLTFSSTYQTEHLFDLALIFPLFVVAADDTESDICDKSRLKD